MPSCDGEIVTSFTVSPENTLPDGIIMKGASELELIIETDDNSLAGQTFEVSVTAQTVG